WHPVSGGSLPQTSSRSVGDYTYSVLQAPGRGTLAGCAPQNFADRAQFLIKTFGRQNVFVELQRHFIRGEERVNQQLVDLAAHYRLPILATNGVQYAQPYGREVLDVFTCIRVHTHLAAAGKLLTRTSERHLKNEREMSVR